MSVNKIIILGAGAAPGVPSLGLGFNKCNPENPKNVRMRTTTYIEYRGVKLLIDTSPDLRTQLINQNIRNIDGVLYSHEHADHLHGIDDLREINRINRQSLNIYAGKETIKTIKKRFNYLIVPKDGINNIVTRPSLVANKVKANHPFYIKGVKITPIKMLDHCKECYGYVFDDGVYVHFADFKHPADSVFKMITVKPKLMTVPLTNLKGIVQHASLEEVLEVIEKIKPEKVIINHMTNECDYDYVDQATPEYVRPAYDNMIVEF